MCQLTYTQYEHTEVLHISQTMCTHGLPDIYTLSPRALGAYIRQTTHAHGITITCYKPSSLGGRSILVVSQADQQANKNLVVLKFDNFILMHI